MAYRIRYGPDMEFRIHQGNSLGMRLFGALAMTIGTIVIRLVWLEGAERLARILARDPASTGELAVFALGQALAKGEGWYQGLAVWCRTIIEAGMA